MTSAGKMCCLILLMICSSVSIFSQDITKNPNYRSSTAYQIIGFSKDSVELSQSQSEALSDIMDGFVNTVELNTDFFVNGKARLSIDVYLDSDSCCSQLLPKRIEALLSQLMSNKETFQFMFNISEPITKLFPLKKDFEGKELRFNTVFNFFLHQ